MKKLLKKIPIISFFIKKYEERERKKKKGKRFTFGSDHGWKLKI